MRGKDWDFDSKCQDRKFKNVMEILAKRFAQAHRLYLDFHFDYDSAKCGDVGWFYNERANIGFLAAAAWLESQWVAIEEYQLNKTRNGRSRLGRADLYIGVTRKKVGSSFSLEAKQAWPKSARELKSALNAKNKKSKLVQACQDARESLPRRYVNFRCGVVFVTPAIRATEPKEAPARRKEIFDAFWEAVGNLPYKNWVAFSYVSRNVEQAWREKSGERYVYPAVGVGCSGCH